MARFRWSILKFVTTGLMIFLATSLATVLAWAKVSNHQGETVSASSATACDSWNIIPSPNVSQKVNAFSAVAPIASNNAWAVGGYGSGPVDGWAEVHALTEHWDGSSWSIIAVPSAIAARSQLSGVAAVSSSDVWAVGWYSNTSTSQIQPLTLHWTGNTWSVVPNPSPVGGQLNAIAVVNNSDVWAVGSSSSHSSTLIEHWNGTTWNIVASPSQGVYSELAGVTAIAANNVWAVGSSSIGTLIEHWNGSNWSITPVPVLGNYDTLSSVSALSSNQIWAAGSSSGNSLIEYWNGSSWNVSPSPNRHPYSNQLNGISAISANNVWAVGGWIGWYSSYNETTLEHWDGVQWSLVDPPDQGSAVIALNGIAALSANEIWAVGASGGAYTPQTYVIRYGCGYSVTPKPSVILVHGWHGVPDLNDLFSVTNCDTGALEYNPKYEINSDFGPIPKWLSTDFDVWIAHLTSSSQ